MSSEIILAGLLAVSVLTSLVTEGIKVILKEYGKSYKANTLAGVVSIVLSVFAGWAYMTITKTAFSSEMAVYIISLIILSWLCAMLGYDKVVQAISQIKTYNKESE